MSESGRLFADAPKEPQRPQEAARGELRVLRPNRAQLLLRPTDRFYGVRLERVPTPVIRSRP